MADNIPTTIIKNVPPFIYPKGNNGNSFASYVSFGEALQYVEIYLAQETDQSTINPTLSSPIEKEDGFNILLD